MMGYPSQHEFENLVREQMIQKCLIMHHDVVNAYKIFGPDLAGVRFKTICKDPTRIQPEYAKIPMSCMSVRYRLLSHMGEELVW